MLSGRLRCVSRGRLGCCAVTEPGSWFILRTHGEEIEEIEGGSWEKIEEDAYLICVENAEVKMQMKTPGLHYYTGKN